MSKLLLQILDTPAGEQFDYQVKSYKQYMSNDVLRFPELIAKIKKIEEDTQNFENYSIYMKWGIRKLEYSFILDNLVPNDDLNILDVGSGITILPHVISRIGCKVDALDPAPEWKLATTEIGQIYNRFYDSDVNYINDYVFSIQGNELYDRIISVSVLEHLPSSEIGRTLDKIIALLKPGGRLIFTIDYCPRVKYHQFLINRIRGVCTIISKIRALKKWFSLRTDVPFGPYSYYDFRRMIYNHLPGRGNLIKLWRKDKEATSYETFWSSHAFEGCLYEGYRSYLALGISCTKL